MKSALSFLAFLFFTFICVRSQNKQVVKGVVTDYTDFIIMGARVVVEGTSVESLSGVDGPTINVQFKQDVSEPGERRLELA